MKPIIFSTPMVQAILEGRKSQTRRVIKPQPYLQGGFCWEGKSRKLLGWVNKKEFSERLLEIAPYKLDDIIWVRETWMPYATIDSFMSDTDLYTYKADWTGISLETQKNGVMGKDAKWRPSIHMPRAAARIFLRVTGVKAERLWDISEKDATAEGCNKGDKHLLKGSLAGTARQSYVWLWQILNDKRNGGIYAWGSNPWVWVIEFERIEKPEGAEMLWRD